MATTDLHITQEAGEYLRVFVNGAMVAEIFGGAAHTEIDWTAELENARRLEALPHILVAFCQRAATIHNREDHNNPRPDDKVAAYLGGFIDGILGVDDAYPGIPNLRMQRDYSPCYCDGYERGEAIRALLPDLLPAQKTAQPATEQQLAQLFALAAQLSQK